MRISLLRTRAVALVAPLFVAGGCDEATRDAVSDAVLRQVTAHYAALVHATYADTLGAAEALEDAVATFVSAPTEVNLTAARTAWLASREPYGQTEAFRFYGGPIDAPETGPEGAINAWPLDEGYIDYVVGAETGGIIQATELYPAIDADLLKNKNEDGGASEVSITLGYHAIEFLLWGQDQSVDGPGARPATDYADGGHANAARRRTFLTLATQILVDDLSTVHEAWLPDDANNYRATFVAMAPRDGIRLMLTGAGVLSNGELSGERMDVALDTRDQEDEHSCFSDNTHRDIITNAKGIRNVLTGEYEATDGTKLTGASVLSVLALTDATLAAKLRAEVVGSVTLAEAIPVPFDQAISSTGGRAAIQATIDALRLQSDTIVDAAAALGIDGLTTALPE